MCVCFSCKYQGKLLESYSVAQLGTIKCADAHIEVHAAHQRFKLPHIGMIVRLVRASFLVGSDPVDWIGILLSKDCWFAAIIAVDGGS